MTTPARSSRLEELDRRLAALPLDCDAMLLSELDGYLAAILVCPDIILPSEWLPLVWCRGGEDVAPIFDNADDLKSLVGLIMRHYNAVIRELGRRRYAPIYDVDERHDETLWEVWIGGFERAMTLRPKSWTAVLKSSDENAVAALGGLVTLVRLGCGDKGELGLEQDTIDELTREAPDLIPHWVEVLHAWRSQNDDLRPDVTAAPAKVGRNDPCPCGSSRKYKKCCGGVDRNA